MSNKNAIFQTPMEGGKPIHKKIGYRNESWESVVKGLNTRAKNRKNRKRKKRNK